MKIDINNITEELSKKVAKAIMGKHSEYPLLLREVKKQNRGLFDKLKKGWSERKEEIKMEGEIYAISFCEASLFFFYNNDAKFDNEVIETLRFQLEQRLKKPKVIKKLSPEEMFASAIKIDVIDFLLEHDIVIP